MAWLYLTLAGLCEIGFATFLEKTRTSEGAPRIYFFIAFILCMAASMALMLKATQKIPMGTAYAVWTGIGAAGTVIVGLVFFKEPINFWRVFFLLTLIGSIAGLKAVSENG